MLECFGVKLVQRTIIERAAPLKSIFPDSCSYKEQACMSTGVGHGLPAKTAHGERVYLIGDRFGVRWVKRAMLGEYRLSPQLGRVRDTSPQGTVRFLRSFLRRPALRASSARRWIIGSSPIIRSHVPDRARLDERCLRLRRDQGPPRRTRRPGSLLPCPVRCA